MTCIEAWTCRLLLCQPPTNNVMPRAIVCWLFVASAFTIRAQELTFQVLDEATEEPLPYATLIVIGAEKGTIADSEGWIRMSADDLNRASTIKVTYLGYEPGVFKISDLQKRRSVDLKPRPIALEPVSISGKPTIIKIGNYRKSAKYTGWGDYSSQRGRVKGIVIDLADGGEPYYLQSLNFHLNHNEWDSVAFRVHLQAVQSDKVGKSLLPENIFFITSQQNAWLEVDLRDYGIVLEKAVVAAIEWVDAWGDTGDSSNRMTFSLSKSSGKVFNKDVGQEFGSIDQSDLSPSIYLKVR